MIDSVQISGIVVQLQRIESHLRLHPIVADEVEAAAALDALIVARSVVSELGDLAESRYGDDDVGTPSI